jgi:hypothetical protein
MDMLRRLGAIVVLGLGLAVATGSAASAQTYTGVTPPNVGQVLSTTGQRTPVVASPPGEVLASQVSSPAAAAAPQAQVRSLALTGADIVGLVLIAGSLIAVGAVFTRSARRSGSHS